MARARRWTFRGAATAAGLAIGLAAGCVRGPSDCLAWSSKRSALYPRYGQTDCTCRKTVVRKTDRRDCDGLPIYALECNGQVIASEPLDCGFFGCVSVDRAGRCYE